MLTHQSEHFWRLHFGPHRVMPTGKCLRHVDWWRHRWRHVTMTSYSWRHNIQSNRIRKL